MPNVCEYSNSTSDCVIYHPITVQKTNIDALAIVIHNDSSESDSDVNIDDLDELVKITVSGSTFEMKIDKINQAAINECINDMFGTGTRLATWGLHMSKVVERVQVFGVVAPMPHPDASKILKLTMDFRNGGCSFQICRMEYNFQTAVNMILHKLHLG